MVIEINNLLTINSFAKMQSVTPTRIYNLIGEDRVKPVIIDGVNFIDLSKYPNIKEV